MTLIHGGRGVDSENIFQINTHTLRRSTEFFFIKEFKFFINQLVSFFKIINYNTLSTIYYIQWFKYSWSWDCKIRRLLYIYIYIYVHILKERKRKFFSEWTNQAGVLAIVFNRNLVTVFAWTHFQSGCVGHVSQDHLTRVLRKPGICVWWVRLILSWPQEADPTRLSSTLPRLGLMPEVAHFKGMPRVSKYFCSFGSCLSWWGGWQTSTKGPAPRKDVQNSALNGRLKGIKHRVNQICQIMFNHSAEWKVSWNDSKGHLYY